MPAAGAHALASEHTAEISLRIPDSSAVYPSPHTMGLLLFHGCPLKRTLKAVQASLASRLQASGWPNLEASCMIWPGSAHLPLSPSS